MIIMIAAAAENNALGKDNKIVWHLPNDFKRFKLLTSGHHIIMGRKTFESFEKPLPNRTHIIITRQQNYKADGCIIVESIEKALAACPKEEDSFIIGGGEIYSLGMPYADKLEITRVHESFDADAYFPEINMDQWKIDATEFNAKDQNHKYDYSYETFIKI
ncbi:dihydrofolate reductase [Flavobacterium micromati]|uniref:Dihydrofolate reductase n=1 Tax=Flavobacterium micromati TaxID=229205 RepID=A0A1M5NQ18_9FLAO|nr:dihydrofolate reductase [Flavobacterium micromati]SHG91567.1 dihydrofolate reductase [Flavobacterium micromati]